MDYRIWLDDLRPAPIGWLWCHSVDEAKSAIREFLEVIEDSEFDYRIALDLDHDLGDYASFGGDAIKLVDWIEANDCGEFFMFHIHTANPVGRQNMMAVIQHNDWEMF